MISTVLLSSRLCRQETEVTRLSNLPKVTPISQTLDSLLFTSWGLGGACEGKINAFDNLFSFHSVVKSRCNQHMRNLSASKAKAGQNEADGYPAQYECSVVLAMVMAQLLDSSKIALGSKDSFLKGSELASLGLATFKIKEVLQFSYLWTKVRSGPSELNLLFNGKSFLWVALKLLETKAKLDENYTALTKQMGLLTIMQSRVQEFYYCEIRG